MVFGVCLLSATIVNMDHGILPACSFELKEELGVEELFIGFLGSVVFGGILLGSLASGYVFSNYSCKKVLIYSMVGLNAGFLAFPLSSSKLLMTVSRFVTGFFQAFLIVFFPVWVDHFGGTHKTRWITLLQLAVLLGVVVGYVLTALLNLAHQNVSFLSWRVSFFLQTAALAVATYIVFLADERDLSTNDILSESPESHEAQAFDEYPVLRLSLFSRHPSMILEAPVSNDQFAEVEDIVGPQPTETLEPLVSEPHGAAKPFSVSEALGVILYKRLYLLAVLTLSSLFFIITVVQFWMSHYLITVLSAPPARVFGLFTLTSVSAPTAGMLLGGVVSERIGGYAGPNALPFCLICACLAAILGLPIPSSNSYLLVTGLVWVQLFFGAAALPTLTGLMISSLAKEVRPLGNAVAQVAFNLLGYIPAPLLYGWVTGSDPDPFSRRGMRLTVAWAFLPVAFLGFGLYKQRQKRKMNELKEELERGKRLLEMMETQRETPQNRGEGYTIPAYEDFDSKKRLRGKMDKLDSEVQQKLKDVEGY